LDALAGWVPMLQQEEAAVSGAHGLLDNAWRPPVHLQLGGSLTYSSARSECASRTGRLCFAREVCPRGDISLGPQGAALRGFHWAPVQDRDEGWIQLGDQRSCTTSWSLPPESVVYLREENSGSLMAQYSKGHVLCCEVGRLMRSIDGNSGIVGTLSNAVRELDAVKANVSAFLAQDPTPPVASSLPGAMATIGATLSAMRNQWPQESSAVASIYSRVQSQFSSATGQMAANASSFQAQQATASASLTTALDAAQVEDATQRSLTAQQTQLQARCEAVLNATAPAPAPAGGGG